MNDTCEDQELAVIDDFLKATINDTTKRAIGDAIDDAFENSYYWLEQQAASHIVGIAAKRAERFWDQVLDGDPDAGVKLLAEPPDRRYRSLGHDAGKPWPHLIHGHLFEVGGMAMRRKIVDAYPDLLKSERIIDLEAVVDGLTRQVKDLESEIDRLRDFH